MAHYYGLNGEQDQFGVPSSLPVTSNYFFPVSSFSRTTDVAGGRGGDREGKSRQRHFYTETQLELLEAEFSAEMFPSRDRRRLIASQLGVTDKSVLWWFQNRRRRVRQQSKMAVEVNSGTGPSRNGRRHHRRSSPYHHSVSSQSFDESPMDNWAVHTAPTWTYTANVISPVYDSVDVISSPEVDQPPIDFSCHHQQWWDYQSGNANQQHLIHPESESSNWNEFQQQSDWQQQESSGAVPVSYNPGDWTGWQYSIPFYPNCHQSLFDQQPLYDFSPTDDVFYANNENDLMSQHSFYN